MKFSPIKLALITAITVSSVALSGCMTTTNETSTKASMEQTAPVIRDFNEALSADYAAMRKQQISDVGYSLYFNIGHTETSYNGKSVIDFTMAEGNKSPITIDFESGNVESVKVNGKTVSFDYEKWFISIAPTAFTSGKNTIEVIYNRPYSNDGSGLHRFKDPANGDVYLYSDFEPYSANKMFPHFDQPNLKSTYKVEVDAPSHWQIISTTRETSIVEKEGVKHWDFPVSAKISSYVFALHAGKYAVWEDTFHGKDGDIPLRLFARQSLAKYVKIDDWFTPTKQSFKFFNNYFDISYPFGKYDQVMAPDFNSGAMENVAAVTFNESFISRGEKTTSQRLSLADTIAHEMAHMWFGDLVTMDWWNGLWLNESFASYMAVLALEKGSDFDNVWDDFYTGFKQWAYRTDKSVNTHAIELPVATTSDAMTNFDGITYGKGASVLKQVPKYLGEENFRKGVSNYLKKYSYQNTTLNDFITSLAQASDTDLTQWTQDWLYKAGVNTIEVSYQCNAGVISEFAIKQSAPEEYPTLRQQRVNVGLFNYSNDAMSLTNEVAVTYKGASTDVSEVVGKACPELVYPNLDDWGYVQVNLDKNSLESLNKHINDFKNPSLRLMLWQSLFDSVSDAKLSPETFVDFALKNLDGEKDLSVIRSISGQLSGALGYLTTATRLGIKDFNDKRNQVNDFYFKQLENAEAGSDLQKLWYGRFVSTTRTPAQLAKLVAILDGKLAFEGLQIDQDKRWRIVRTLNHHEVGNYKERLAEEIKRDNSDIGAKNAILAEVLRPDPAVKAKWFDIIINNPDNLKLATLRYAMFGMFPGDQKALEAPYKDRILAHIESLNTQGNLKLLGAFAGSMLPTSCTNESYQELGELVEKYKDMKPQVLKGVKRSHQEVGRCVKVLNLLK
ncbi:aminopeptidase N [Psychrosphaera saromensis]|uniref:Aminopeptidase N n=1 Tax=Psychrosphaera saromensis TaxID=716813 RepID=A0A2S7UWI3_9GAMM|nr:aminopeptidase N [Psychrosphaera saromensis]PQJ54354.1 aminopeptidase N [Psychrosphaera saromensis]GHB60684.1 aminopeptidase N [Psychrosphaera saromensis]GLQ14561.1 aminopeptidase N [Psychrosphaera saromensis]